MPSKSNELRDMLRNPDGPYFADDTPAMIALEHMVDTVGLRNVLFALATIAYAKAEHLESNWQDRAMAQAQERRGAKLNKLARSLSISDDRLLGEPA